MSWAIVAELKQRFPDIEPFPHDEPHHDEPAAPAAEPATELAETAPKKPVKHEAKGPVFHVPGAHVPADRLLEIGRVLRDEARFHFDYLSFVTAIDRPDQQQFEVVYHLYSMGLRHEVLLKVRVPRATPRVSSVVGLWQGADWHEREAYDLFGITFERHPDLRRLMMTEDWAGHPLRKDYVYEEPRWLVDLATQRQKEIEGLGLGDRA
jgi:NADH-quinone oxidoreductase subunit C